MSEILLRKIKIEPKDDEEEKPLDNVVNLRRIKIEKEPLVKLNKRIKIEIPDEVDELENALESIRDPNESTKKRKEITESTKSKRSKPYVPPEDRGPLVVNSSSESSDSAVEAEKKIINKNLQRERLKLEKIKAKKRPAAENVLSTDDLPKDSGVPSYTPEEIENLLNHDPPMPIESGMTVDELREIQQAVNGNLKIVGSDQDKLEGLDSSERVYFRKSYKQLLEQRPPATPQQRAERVAKNPFEFEYIRQMLSRLPRDVQSRNEMKIRDMTRRAIHANTRAHEESYMCAPQENEFPCCNGDHCVGREIPVSKPFTLKAFLFENEHEKYISFHERPAEVENGERECILCMRKRVLMHFMLIRASGPERIDFNPRIPISRYRNIVDDPNEYRLEDCIASTDGRNGVLIEPVVAFKLTDYDVEIRDGILHYQQKLAYPDTNAVERKLDEAQIYDNQQPERQQKQQYQNQVEQTAY